MDTSSYETIGLVRKWLATCNSEHPKCAIPPASALPTRLLEVGNRRVKLVEPRGEIAPYFTLSHCWGQATITELTKATLSDMKKNIPWTSLSKAFQDAVMITWRLGVRYLWIDGLCILQDSKEDWEYQASQMAHIFSNSQLTIAASHAANGSQGCFSRRLEAPLVLWGTQSRTVHNPALWTPFEIEGRDRDGIRKKFSVCITTPHGLYRRKQPKEALLKRAWVFQEQILSSRILHFASGELYFECRSHVVCECSDWSPRSDSSQWETRWRKAHAALLNRGNDPWLKIKPREQNANDFEAYRALVEAYTQLDITAELDRLPALSGVTFGRQDEYLAGMWRGILLECLHWAPSIPNPQTVMMARRPRQYRAPTWSWASIEAPIYHVETDFYKYSSSPEHVATVVSARCKPEGMDPRGRVVSGTLKIRGPIVTAQVTEIGLCESETDRLTKLISINKPKVEKPKVCTYATLKSTKHEGRCFLDVPLALCRTEPTEVVVGQIVTCLMISTTTALVLKPVPATPGAYYRVGVFKGSEGWTFGPQDTVVIL